jgi:hypothetical protein
VRKWRGEYGRGIKRPSIEKVREGLKEQELSGRGMLGDVAEGFEIEVVS